MTTLIEFLVNELPKRGGWPKGAVEAYRHLRDDFPGFYDEDGGSVSREYGRSLNLCSVDLNLDDDELGETVTREQYEAALAASKPEWDGEGLPPVGIEAEVSVDGGRTWCLYKATSERNGMRLVEIGNFTEEFQSNNWTFRPVRSEADKKRDEAAKGLIEYLDKETDIDNVFSIQDVIGFYDAIAAGKIPHIRID